MRKKFFILFSIFTLLAIFGATGFVYAIGYEIPFPTAVEEAAAGEGIAGYVNRLYIYALGLVGLTALGAIIFGGVLYTTSAGNPSLQGDAKKRINSALIGLGILLTSYLILYTINPDLVNLRNPSMGSVIDVNAPRLGAAGACEDSTNCGAGYRCEGYVANVSKGTCILAYISKCEQNEQCGGGYECKKGKCVSTASTTLECSGDTQCETSKRCFGNKCISFPSKTIGRPSSGCESVLFPTGCYNWSGCMKGATKCVAR